MQVDEGLAVGVADQVLDVPGVASAQLGVWPSQQHPVAVSGVVVELEPYGRGAAGDLVDVHELQGGPEDVRRIEVPGLDLEPPGPHCPRASHTDLSAWPISVSS